MRVSRTLKLDSVTWLKVKGEKKKRGRGERRELEKVTKKRSGHLTKRWVSQKSSLGSWEPREMKGEYLRSHWLCEDIFVVVKLLPAESL